MVDWTASRSLSADRGPEKCPVDLLLLLQIRFSSIRGSRGRSPLWVLLPASFLFFKRVSPRSFELIFCSREQFRSFFKDVEGVFFNWDKNVPKTLCEGKGRLLRGRADYVVGVYCWLFPCVSWKLYQHSIFYLVTLDDNLYSLPWTILCRMMWP